MRLLIVEDNPITRMLMTDMLESRGHQVVAEAQGVAEAVEAYRALKPDAVTLDLSLGQDDGFQVLDALRRLDAKVKVLVISGNAQKQIRKQVQEAGAAGFLPKPYSGDDLQSALIRITSP